MAEDWRPLSGTSPEALAAELRANQARFDPRSDAAALARHPLLVIGAEKGIGAENTVLADLARKAASRVTAATLPTDHSFNDHRVALTAAMLRWLEQFAEGQR
jgi:hypothetical protein